MWMGLWMMIVAEIYKIDPHTSVGAIQATRLSDSSSVIQTVEQLDKASYGLHCDEC